MNKLRLGILCRNYNSHENWEKEIFNEIISSPHLELVLLLKDGRKEVENSFMQKLKLALTTKNKIGKIIFHSHVFLERLLFKEKSIEYPKYQNLFDSTEVKFLNPVRKGYLDVFNDQDYQELKKHNLDVILRHEFNIIRGPILKSAKYGIWSFHHGDNSVYRGRPAGFWEILNKEKSIGITLQQLTSELDGGLIIGKAYYNKHWSFVKTNRLLLHSSASLLFKHLKIVYQTREITLSKSLTYFNPLYKVPEPYIALKYMGFFYKNLFSKAFEKFCERMRLSYFQKWTLVYGKGEFLYKNLGSLNTLRTPKNEFWADPFLFDFENRQYVFFENYEYKQRKGKISVGIIQDDKIVGVVDALNKAYHLSYPFLFTHKKEIYMIPETSNNNRLEIYRCLEIPGKWELYKTAFEGEKIIDATIFQDANKVIWLFLNKQRNKQSCPHSELYIYKVSNWDEFILEEHKNNPVYIDSRVARSAGNFFIRNGVVYRPSQTNVEGIYGRGININRIISLNLDEFIEETLLTVKPEYDTRLISSHHISQGSDSFIFDVAFKKS